DLSAHVCLTYEYSPLRNAWPFRDRQGQERNVRIAGPVHANNGRFLEAMAVAGIGICYEPDFIVGPDVRAGRLTPLLLGFQPQAKPGAIVAIARTTRVSLRSTRATQRSAPRAYGAKRRRANRRPRVRATESCRRRRDSARRLAG